MTSVGGPCAPGKGRVWPFVIEQGGRLAPQAEALLRLWAQANAGDCEPGGHALSPAAISHLRSSMQLITTVLQGWRVQRAHQAAEWLVFQEASAASAAAAAGGRSRAAAVWSRAGMLPGRTRSEAPRAVFPLVGGPALLVDLDPVALALTGEAWTQPC